jgi:hypothetical protein
VSAIMDQNRKSIGCEPAQATLLTQNPLAVLMPETLLEFGGSREPRPTVIFRSEYTGEGDPVLGRRLTNEFVQALLDHPEPPQALLLYHSGVFLALDTSPVIDMLRQLMNRGSDILVCKTSLQYLAPDRLPAVGRPAPLAELIDRMRQAHLLLWP